MPDFTFDGSQWTEEELAAIRMMEGAALLEFNRIKGATMSPPRRPRGEKPKITIRYLQRQVANLQTRISTYYDDIQHKNKQIATQDVELSECADRERILESETASYADRYGTLLGVHQNQALRLQFLEGYYHAKRETFPGSGPGYQGAHQDGAATGHEARQADTAQRDGGAIGSQIRGFGANHPAPDNRRSVAGETIADEVGGGHSGPGWTRR